MSESSEISRRTNAKILTGPSTLAPIGLGVCGLILGATGWLAALCVVIAVSAIGVAAVRVLAGGGKVRDLVSEKIIEEQAEARKAKLQKLGADLQKHPDDRAFHMFGSLKDLRRLLKPEAFWKGVDPDLQVEMQTTIDNITQDALEKLELYLDNYSRPSANFSNLARRQQSKEQELILEEVQANLDTLGEVAKEVPKLQDITSFEARGEGARKQLLEKLKFAKSINESIASELEDPLAGAGFEAFDAELNESVGEDPVDEALTDEDFDDLDEIMSEGAAQASQKTHSQS